MSYRTVNVKPETHRRLKAYKAGGFSFDDVLQVMMDKISIDEVHDLAVAEEKAREEARRKAAQADRIRESPAAKAPVTPGFVRFSARTEDTSRKRP